MTGMMVRKMPANSLATSSMGAQENWLSAWMEAGVMRSETMMTASSPRSRSRPGSVTSAP